MYIAVCLYIIITINIWVASIYTFVKYITSLLYFNNTI